MPTRITSTRCAPASRSIRPSPATGRSKPTRCRSPRSPNTRRRPPTWWTRSASTTEQMIAAKSAGWPSLERWPARSHFRWRAGPAAVAAVAVAAAALALAPLLGLIFVALGETGDIWAHLVRYVIPVALWHTALLLVGVALVTIIVGVGTAWIVTTFQFPGRDALIWLLALPLAIPTYIVAYI